MQEHLGLSQPGLARNHWIIDSGQPTSRRRRGTGAAPIPTSTPATGCGRSWPVNCRRAASTPPMAVVPWWIETHCVIPDGFRAGRRSGCTTTSCSTSRTSTWSAATSEFDPINPILSTAFRYRRGMNVGPQKVGKSPERRAHLPRGRRAVGVRRLGRAPATATLPRARLRLRLGVRVRAGEPMGMLRPTPWIQIIAVSEDQTDNVYRALRPMIEKGPLRFLMPKTGEELHPAAGRRPDRARHELERLSPDRRRSTFVVETEAGLYTKRNGMRDGRRRAPPEPRRHERPGDARVERLGSGAAVDAQLEYELVEKGKVDDVYIQFAGRRRACRSGTRPSAGRSCARLPGGRPPRERRPRRSRGDRGRGVG
jgi:hypothetical protein